MNLHSSPHAGHAPRPFSRSALATRQVVLQRMLRVLRLDRTVYGEVTQQLAAARQAGWVVAMVTIAAAIGATLVDGWHPGAILGAALAAVIHWLLWTSLIFVIGTTLFHSTVSLRNLLAAMGYAQAPQVLAILGFIPVAGPVIVVISRLLSAICGSQATGSTFDLERRRRIATSVIAFVISLALTTLLKAWLGDTGPWQALVRP